LIVVADTDIFMQHFTDRSGKTDFIVFLVLMAGTAFRYSGQFRNKNVFWQNAVKNSPSSPLAHRNRGAMLYLDGDMEGAAGEYKAALQLNENEQMVHNNLGLIFLRQGNYSEAERYFRKEININPNFANAYYNLGLVYWAQKKTHDAAFMWK
jgi:tetratricopeptide (TPR) repeat protein